MASPLFRRQDLETLHWKVASSQRLCSYTLKTKSSHETVRVLPLGPSILDSKPYSAFRSWQPVAYDEGNLAFKVI